MSTQTIIIIIAIVMVVVLAFGGLRRGPRVTHIDRTVKRDKDEQTGLYDAHFGMILTQEPHVCKEGYEGTDTRPPQDLRDLPMNEDARCTEPQSQSSARGAQHAPRAGAAYRAPVIGTYESETGTVTYSDEGPSDSVTYTGGAAAAFGEDSWKWLLLQPLAEPRK